MDMRKYLSKTEVIKKVAFDDIKDSPFDMFTTWMYQNHLEQSKGSSFKRHIDNYFENLEAGGWGYHWDDFLDSTGFERDGDLIEITLSKAGVDVLGTYTVSFMPLDENNLGNATDEDIDYLKRIGYTTAIGLDSELLVLYTEHFDEVGVEYNYYENNLYIADYVWGYDYLYRIEKSDANRIIATLWSNIRAANYLEDENYFYLIHSEEFEGYGDGFDIVDFFDVLYNENKIQVDQEVVFQILYEDHVENAYNDNIKIFFDKLAKRITKTSEVIF